MAPYDDPDYVSYPHRRSHVSSPCGEAEYGHRSFQDTRAAGPPYFTPSARRDWETQYAATPTSSINATKPYLQAPPTASQSPYRRRKSWPPAPRCEDERASLAREAGHRALLNAKSDDETPSRGSIDQEPVIQDVDGFIDGHRTDSKQDAKPERNKTNSLPSRNAGLQAVNSIPLESVPEITKRTSSPYAYTKQTKPKDTGVEVKSVDPDINLSLPNVKDAGKRSHLAGFGLPRQDGHQSIPSRRKGSDDIATFNIDHAAVEIRERSTTKYATPRPDRDPDYAAVFNDADHDAPHRTSKHRPRLDGRRKTDLTDLASSARKAKVEKPMRNPTPLVVSRTVSDFNSTNLFTASPDTLRPGDGILNTAAVVRPGSRGPSPAASSVRDGNSPHRSSRLNTDKQYDSRPGSATQSKASSLAGSRPASPFSRPANDDPHLPSWSHEHMRPSSSHNARATTHLLNLTNTGRGSGTNALPYPDDDWPTIAMPVEKDHQYIHDLPPANTPFSNERSPSWQATFTPTNEPFSPTHQPYMSVSRTSTSTMSSADAPPRADEPRHASVAGGETRKELSDLVMHAHSLPGCNRPHLTRDYDDWFTIINAPDIDICPDCVESLFERTKFRSMVRRSLPKSSKTRTQCAFGASAWIRLAWVMTLRQQRSDLLLLRGISEIEMSNESCPGDRGAIRSWYGLRDLDGLYVRDFHICYTDVRKVECLLPSLTGMFVRLPARNSPDPELCGMRCESNRFSTYIDALVLTHERAVKSQRAFDPMSFISLVEQKTQSRECSRDNMLIGALWHFIPKVPTFTVCEDCFDSIVDPEIQNRSEIAMQFNRTPLPAQAEGMGSSCQLYSARMRRILRRAIDDDDLTYLSRKATERREAELRLQERHKEVMRKLKRMSRDRTITEDDERRMRRELERITSEWQAKWE